MEYLEPDSDLPYFYGQRVANERETMFGHILGHSRFPFIITVAWDGGGFSDCKPDELIFYPPKVEEPPKEWRRSRMEDFYNESDPDYLPEPGCWDIQDCTDCPLLLAGKCPEGFTE